MFSNCFPLRRQSGKNHSKIGGLDWSPHATTASGSTRRPDVNEEQVNRNPYVLQSLEESFLKRLWFLWPSALEKTWKKRETKQTTRKKPPQKRVTACASMPTHATPGRPKANGEQGWVFGSDPKATKAKATNCQRVWVLKDRKDSNTAQEEILTTSFWSRKQRPKGLGFGGHKDTNTAQERY